LNLALATDSAESISFALDAGEQPAAADAIRPQSGLGIALSPVADVPAGTLAHSPFAVSSVTRHNRRVTDLQAVDHSFSQ